MKRRLTFAVLVFALASCLGRTPVHASDSLPSETVISLHFSPSGKPVATLNINGKNHDFLVDTGATNASLSEQIVREEHLKTHVETAGQRSLKATEPVTWKQGNLKLMLPLVVMPQKQVDALLSGDHAVGILGGNVLSRFNVLFDFPGGKLTLFYPAGVSPALLKRCGFQNIKRIPTTDPDRNWYHLIPARFSQNGKRAKVTMLIDTGANVTIISMKAARNLGIEFYGESFASSMDGTAIMRNSFAETIQFGNQTWTHVDISIFDRKDFPQLSQVLGMNVLSKYKMLLDYKTHSLWLKP